MLEGWGANGIIADQKGHNLHCSAPQIVFGEPSEKLYTAKKTHISLPHIITDNETVAKMALSHLLDHGFRRFAFCGFDDMIWSRQREEYFYKEVTKYGYECHIYKQAKSKLQRLWKNEKPTLVNWLKSLPRPIGVMVCSDDRGQDVIEAAKIVGVQLPDQIAIVGVDNEDILCSLAEPSLSSIALNTEKAGFETAELLAKLMNGQKMNGQKIIIEPTHVITRASTDVLAVEDKHVAEAMRFIRQNAKKKIQVSDVVTAAGISRCSLYKRFFYVRGHSLYEEIIHTRMEQVAQMLLETDMSVFQIAYAMGDDNDKHIARAFRKEFGISPQAYRKRHNCP